MKLTDTHVQLPVYTYRTGTVPVRYKLVQQSIEVYEYTVQVQYTYSYVLPVPVPVRTGTVQVYYIGILYIHGILY